MNSAMRRTGVSPSAILLLHVGAAVHRALEDGAEDVSPPFPIHLTRSPDALMARLRGAPEAAAVVALGPELESPLAVAEEVHTVDPEVPVVLLTDRAGSGELDRGLMAPRFRQAEVGKAPAWPPAAAAAEILRAAHRRLRRQRSAAGEPNPWFQAALSSIGDAVIAADEESRVTFMNPMAEALTGWSGREARGRAMDEVLHLITDGSREPMADPSRAALRTGSPVGLEGPALLVARDGGLTPIDDSAAPILGDRDEPLGAVVVFRDITARRASERALWASKEEFRLVLESLREYAIFSTDREGRIRTWNPGARKLLGWEEEEIVGRPVHVIFSQEDRRDGVPEWELKQALEAGRAMDDRWHVRKDDTHFWASGVMAPLRGEGNGTVEGFVKILRDETDEKRAREHLEARARQQEAVARFGMEALASSQLQELVDKAARTVAGTLKVELCEVLRLLPDGSRLRLEGGLGWAPGTLGERIVDGGRNSQAGYTLETGVPVVMEDLAEETRFTPSPLLVEHQAVSGMTVSIGGAGNPWGVLGAHSTSRTDFSLNEVHFLQSVANTLAAAIQRRATEEELQALNETLEQRVEERAAESERKAVQLQRMAVELTRAEHRERRRLADMLHDHLQQYLAAGSMQLGSLWERVGDPEARASVARAQTLMEQSIEISRNLTLELSPPVLQRGSLGDAFRWLAGWMKEHHGLAVHVAGDADADPDWDEARNLVFQSVRELLFNVTKHSGVRRAAVHLRCPDAEHLQVTVLDRGRGFDPDQSNEGSRDAGGFGLLSIRERLEVLGGHAQVDAAPGKGTSVTLTIPLAGNRPLAPRTLRRDSPSRRPAPPSVHGPTHR